MKLAFNTWVYSSFPVWVPSYPLEETIKRLSKIGYDGIEIGAAAPHAYPDYLDENRRTEIRKHLQEHNIAVSAMLPAPGGGPGFNVASPLDAERKNAIEQYKKVAELCSHLGGETLLYVAGWQIYGTEREQALEWSRLALSDVADAANDLGVTVVVEPTPVDSNLIESCDDAIYLMKASERENVKLMFDTIHVLYRNEVPTDYVYRMASDLHYVHLSEPDRLPPGSGRADFVGLIDALNDVNYRGYLSMEIGFNRRDVEPDQVARQAFEYVSSLLSK